MNFVASTIKSDIKARVRGQRALPEAGRHRAGRLADGACGPDRAAKLEASDGDAAFYHAKIATARFFADHILSQAAGLRSAIVGGSAGVLSLDADQF